MFHNWGFLLTEIVVLLAIAALLGLFIGWLVWGRTGTATATAAADTGEADRLRAALAECKSRGDEAQARAARLETELAQTKARAVTAETATAPAALMSAPATAPKTAEEPAAKAPSKPKGLTEARGGKADDLKLIKGIGPALEKLCHKLGYFHFDQIASWTDKEIAWVDDNLEGFKGRVTRDEWVSQARDLAKGLPPRAGGEN
jgi:predicted flap endonuclease-1-like 5' DNA nuclease